MNDKMRADFEAWYADHFSRARGVDCSAEIISSMREGDLYGDRGYLNGCWIGWQASRAALEIEMPEQSPETPFSRHMVMDSSSVIEAIEAAGVRVKP